MKTKLVGFALGVGLCLSALGQTFQIQTRLSFDFTNALSVPDVDGFVLYQSTNVALPLSQWTPIMWVSKTNYSLPGSGFLLPVVTNTVDATAPARFFYALQSTNSTYGTNFFAASFSNVAPGRGVPNGGSNLRGL